VSSTRNLGRNPWAILVTVSLGLFMTVIDMTILSVALPTLVRDLGASTGEVEWTLIVYTLAMAALVPMFGRISDVFGRKRLFIAGLLIFAVSSLLCAQSPSVMWLIAARLVQALGGAMISSNSLAIISDTFPAGKRGLAMGIQSIVISGGAALGPTLGGFLVTRFSWEAVFYINLPVGLVAALLAAVILPPLKSHRTLEPIDYIGAATMMGGLTGLLLGLTKGGDWGWTTVPTLSFLATGALLLAFFVIWENRVPYPLIDLSLFRNWEFGIGQLTGLFTTMSMASTTFLFPFYWQGMRGMSAQEAGLLMLPMPLVFMLVSPIAGRLSDSVGARKLALAGLSSVVVGLLFMSTITADMAIAGVLVRVTIFSFGLSLFMSPNSNAVMSAVVPQKRGVAAGLLGTSRYMGQSLGVAFGATIFGLMMVRQTALGYEGLPGAGTMAALSQNPEALVAFQQAFISAMSTVFLASVPLAGVGLVLSVLRFRHPAGYVASSSHSD